MDNAGITRTTYATEKLPRDKAERIVAKINELFEFLETEKVMTHEAVRFMCYPMECSRAMLIGDITAAKYFEKHR